MTQVLLGDPALRARTGPPRIGRLPAEVAPVDLQLDIRLWRPRPFAGVPEVEVTLATADPARLEILDVAGRRVATHELAGSGPGSRTLQLDAATKLAPGIYWLRLTQAGRSAHARVAVLK